MFGVAFREVEVGTIEAAAAVTLKTGSPVNFCRFSSHTPSKCMRNHEECLTADKDLFFPNTLQLLHFIIRLAVCYITCAVGKAL
jgi:hypothetical protein